MLQSRWDAVAAALVAAIVLIHLGNVFVPAVSYDESIHINVGATLATAGEYGNTWESERLITPDRTSSSGLLVVAPVALAWKAGLRDPVRIRLATITPFFLITLILFWNAVAGSAPQVRAWAFGLFLGIPGWGIYAGRVLGEVPAMCLTLAGAGLVSQGRFLWAGLLWGLAASTKLVFLPALLFGLALFCWTTHKSGKDFSMAAAGMLFVPALFWFATVARYGQGADLNLSRQGFIVLFHPRNLPLNLASLNQYLPIVLIPLAYLVGWAERNSRPKTYLLSCLSSFWILWHLVGFRGWPRYALPGLMLLAPAAAAGLWSIAVKPLPNFVRTPFLVTTAAYFLLGVYTNTYSIWTYFKAWRDQSAIASFLLQHKDRRLLGEGQLFPFPEYQWLTGLKFESARGATPGPGDIVVLAGENSFAVRELAAGRRWKLVLSAPSTIPPTEIYEGQ